MAQSLPSSHIEAHIGDVSGGSQVAVGNYIVQIGRVEGGVVNILNEAPPPPRIRPQPVLLRPRIFPELLDRQTETTTLIDALKSQQSVECTGEPGAGRTSLLRHLAYQSQLPAVFPSGVVYFQVNQQSAPDLLKSLFDAFYTCDFPMKPNETEMRHYLQSVNALVLLDDVGIEAQQIELLMNIAPSCTFVAVTRARNLSTDVTEIPVRGLPTGDAVALFQNELGRTLLPEEEKGARSICESVECIPLLVVRAAHEARQQNRSLGAVVSETKPAPGDQRLAAKEIESSSADEKKILAALAVFSGTSIAAEHVAAVAGVPGAQSTLDDLEQRGLVESHEHHYALAPDLKPEQLGDRKPWFTRALNYFVDWTEQHRNQHKLVAAAGGPILSLLKQAVDSQSWSEVKRLCHASEEALTVAGKWDMWANVLDSVELAANAQGDVAERAWVLHQLGTRALCLGDRYSAETNLRDALGLRERLNDFSGAAVTRHNLDVLLGPSTPESDGDSSDGGGDVGPEPAPLWLKAGVIALVGLAVLLAGLYLSTLPTVNPPRIASFTVNPATIHADGQAQLCYEVENAASVSIEPDIRERSPATSECLNVTPSETLTYTLTAFAANGATTSQQARLTVETADGPKPPPPLPQIQIFTASSEQVVDDGISKLCFQLKYASTAQLDPGARPLRVSADEECVNVRPLKRTTYTLRAFNTEGKEARADKTINVIYTPKIVEFTVRPPRITRGDSVSVCFKVENASRVDIEPEVARNRSAGRGGDCVQHRPRATTTYTITAFNEAGLKSEPHQETVTVDLKHARILFFEASPQQIRRGGSINLCYGVADAITTTISPLQREVPSVRRKCVRDSPRESTRYVLTAVGEDDKPESMNSNVIVEEPPVPQVRIRSFDIKPRIFRRPQLCYAVENASRARIDPGIGDLRNLTSGCPNVPSLKQQTYKLTATGADGKTETRTVTYTPPEPSEAPIQIISFSGPARPIKPGSEAELCYITAGEGTAEITPLPGTVPVPPAGRKCVSVFPDRTTEYTLTVTSRQGEKKSRKLTVNVLVQVIQ